MNDALQSLVGDRALCRLAFGAGEPMSPKRLSEIVKGYVDSAGIEKHGSCHMFRHTMATLMLEGGADIRFIQAMLGHAALSTTDIYTQVSIRKLKRDSHSDAPRARRANEHQDARR